MTAAVGTVVDKPARGAVCGAGAGARSGCETTAALVAGLIDALLMEKARDGMISLADARRIVASVVDGSVGMDAAFLKQEAACRRKFSGRAGVSARRAPFTRLMVRPLEQLVDGDRPVFPRTFLPRYLEVLKAAFEQRYDHYESHCRTIFQMMVVQHGADLSWDAFYGDQRAQRILLHALKHLLMYLRTPAGQWAWVQSMSRENGAGVPAPEQVERVHQALADTFRALYPQEEAAQRPKAN